MATRLDRDRPLWRYWLVEGLAGDRWALISRSTTAWSTGCRAPISTGTSSTPGRSPGPRPRRRRPPKREPSGAELMLLGARGLFALPVSAVRGAGALLARPREGGQRLAALVRGGTALLGNLRAAAPSSLTGPRHRPRHFAVARGRVADVRAIRHRHGGTFNDVVLAAVTAGFRALLLARGEEPTPIRSAPWSRSRCGRGGTRASGATRSRCCCPACPCTSPTPANASRGPSRSWSRARRRRRPRPVRC